MLSSLIGWMLVVIFYIVISALAACSVAERYFVNSGDEDDDTLGWLTFIFFSILSYFTLKVLGL